MKNTDEVEIESKKFIKALEEIANDEDIGRKISFLNKNKELIKKQREMNESSLKDSLNNTLNPQDLDYDSIELADEFSKIKMSDSLHESRFN